MIESYIHWKTTWKKSDGPAVGGIVCRPHDTPLVVTNEAVQSNQGRMNVLGMGGGGGVSQLSPYLICMETSWRPVGDSSLRGSRRRLRDVSLRH